MRVSFVGRKISCYFSSEFVSPMEFILPLSVHILQVFTCLKNFRIKLFVQAIVCIHPITFVYNE